jgi:hypothetical protein
MKLRIANIGVPANHEALTTLPLRSTHSLSDFDALIFLPSVVGKAASADIADPTTRFGELVLKETQVQELLNQKAGVVLVLLTSTEDGAYINGRVFDGYYLLGSSLAGKFSVKPGTGTSYKLAPTASSAGRKYFRTLEGHLQFDGYLSKIPEGATVIAHNSVDQVISAQVNVGNGKVIVLPLPAGVTLERIGAAVVETVIALLKDDPEIVEPDWASSILVPSSNSHDALITELRNRHRDIKEQLKELESKKANLLRFRHLLYGTGKTVLETAVRVAFRLLQFEVPEPEEYSGEWDVELRLPDGRTAIGEVEGAEGVVSVDKFRQLHHYLGEELFAGRNHKGVLVGNGFRLQEPSSRPPQFSEHTINAALKFGVCLVPASELFNCATSVLENPEDHALRRETRESLLSTVGPWAFARRLGLSANPSQGDDTPPKSAA